MTTLTKDQQQYIEHEVQLRVLESKNQDMYREFTKIDSQLSEIRNDIKSHFHWVIGSISVLYISLIGTLVTALAKSLHWF